MKFYFFILTQIALIGHTRAYPIFYTCQDEQLKTAERLNTEDLFEKIIRMSKADQIDLANQWCKGKEECLNNLKLIMSFSSSSYEVAKELFLQELNKIKKDINGRVEDVGLLNSLQSIKSSFASLQACQMVSEKLNPEDFVNNEDLLISYPYHNNYMYVTGCYSVNGKRCSPIQKSNMDKVIEESISMGTDPYLTIGLTLMEEGPRMGGLYLDPIGVMDAVGCSARQVKNNKAGALNSYGTSYVVNSSVIENDELSDSLNSFISLHSSQDIQTGESFYCYDTLGEKKPQLYDSLQSNSCCLKLNFQSKSDNSWQITDRISDGLTYEFINKRLSSSFRGRSEPEWKIQRFNGYTNLMGAAEGVPSWRMGVNYYKNPGYGQQVMDYILNSLMFNPYISQKIKEETAKQNKQWKSIICKGREDGTYYYDSEHYHTLVKNSARLEDIKNKYDEGATLEDFSEREKKVLLRELEETSSKNPHMNNLLKKAVWNKYERIVSDAIAVDVEDLFLKEKRSNIEVYNTFKGRMKISKEELFFVLDLYNTQDELEEKAKLIEDKRYKIENKINDLCNQLYDEYTKISSDNSYQDEKQSKYDTYSRCQSRELDKDPILKPFHKSWIEISEKLKTTETKIENLWKGQNLRKAETVYEKDPSTIRSLYGSRYQVSESINEALKRLSVKEGYTSDLRNKIIALYNHEKNQSKGLGLSNEALKEYFENIYPTRKTLYQTSDYTWERLNEAQVEKIIKKLKSP